MHCRSTLVAVMALTTLGFAKLDKWKGDPTEVSHVGFCVDITLPVDTPSDADTQDACIHGGQKRAEAAKRHKGPTLGGNCTEGVTYGLDTYKGFVRCNWVREECNMEVHFEKICNIKPGREALVNTVDDMPEPPPSPAPKPSPSHKPSPPHSPSPP